MAIEAAARNRGLGFVPLVSEDYYLACLKSSLDQPATQALLRTLQSSAWQERLCKLAGYAPGHSGEVLSLHRQLPWWNLPPKKARKTP